MPDARQTPLDSLFSYQAPLESAIKTIFDEFAEQLPEHSHGVQWALNTIEEYALRPSKRIRGCLAAFTYDNALHQKVSPEGVRLGVVLEFIQNHLLIVDDVMDRSSVRRGAPTVHELHKTQFNSGDRVSDSAAILVGMLAQQLSSLALTKINVEASRVLLSSRSVYRNIAITDIGQFDDIHQTVVNAPVSYEDLIRRYSQKSSYYSFVAPIEAALLLAGRPTDRSRCDAEAFGIPAGVAFQLHDDYIGIFGNATQTGKHNLDDIHEGKYTVLVHSALEQADAADARQLRSILANEEAGEAEPELARSILKRSGSVDRAMEETMTYARAAKQAANKAASWDESYAEILCALVDFAVERTS